MKRLCLTLILFFSTAGAMAMCFEEAAHRYSIPAELLKAIAEVESGFNPSAINDTHAEKTGSYDIGLMQINSRWLPTLKKHGITESMLKEPCQNVIVGAWVLAHTLREVGSNWNGVGAYNASCKSKTAKDCIETRYSYSWKVYRALKRQNDSRKPVHSTLANAEYKQAAEPEKRKITSIELASGEYKTANLQ